MPEPNHKTAMISSTSLDLPEHRQQAIAACLRQGIFPHAMEHLPASDTDAINDLHPIVRGVVWQALDVRARRDIYGVLHSYFDAAPRPPEFGKVESLADLTPGIELFHTLIGLER